MKGGSRLMKKVFSIFCSMLFVVSLSFAVVGCSKIEEDSANLRKAAKELELKNAAKKAAAEVKDVAKDAKKEVKDAVKDTKK